MRVKRFAQVLLAVQAVMMVVLGLWTYLLGQRGLSLLLTATLALIVGSFAALVRQTVEWQAAQQALAESEARYRAIFQTAADGFGLVDKDARLLEVNDALCRMSGYSAEQLRNKRVSDLQISETEGGMAGHIEHARTHSDERFSTRLRRQGGDMLEVEISAQYRPIDSGRFVIVVRDVTELRRAQAVQRQSEEMLLGAFSASPAAIWISDAKACVAINDAFESMTGFSRADVIGKTGDDISLYESPHERDRLLEKLRQSGGPCDAELRFRKKDGELRNGVFNAQTARIGDKTYAVVVVTDVTDAKRAEVEHQQRSRVETLMADLAAKFLHTADSDLDPLMHDALARICACFDFDRGTIWQPERGAPERVVRTHLIAPGEPPLSSGAPPLLLSDFPWVFEKLSSASNRALVLEVDSLPDEADQLREQYRQLGITHTISIPWCAAPGSIDGLVSFSSKRGRRLEGAAINQVETLARMILVVLGRARESRATAEVRERMRTQLEMLDDAPAGITINTRGKFLYANKQAVAMHGYTPEEFAQRSLPDLVAPEERARLDDIRLAIRELGAHSFMIWHCRKDGTRVHLAAQVRRSTWLGHDANISVFVDLSERDRSESQLRQTEERYRLLAENISDVISVLDLETERFEYVSPSVLGLRGYKADEAIGQLLEATLTSDSLARARRRVVQLLEAERTGRDPAPEENDGSVVYQQLCKDGSTVPTEVRARIVRDPTSGKPLLLSVSRDITERQKSEKERAELQQQLYQSQKMEAIGGLAGGVAHDFNNLLSVIMSYTDFVVDNLAEDDQRRSDLLEVQKASDRAAALVRQLLAFSRKQILELRVIDLNQVVSGVEKMLRRLVGEDVQLDVVLADGLGTVLADAGQVEQVLMNLVVNARDAMPRGGRLTIRTGNVEIAEGDAQAPSDLKPGRYVTFAVADTGSGMDASTLARAFEPFFTTKGLGKGTGLGLSTVYGIVKQSEGEVQVTSTPGAGTVFTIYLRRRDARLSEHIPKAALGASTGHETVLVVEDEDSMRALIERILRNAGYRVLTAENGSDALALFDKYAGKIDLLLTDVVMPQMSGREVAEQLSRAKPSIKVLYMSGYTDEIIGRHGVLEAGVRLIGKPFAAAEMTRRVRMLLDEEPRLPA